LNNNNNNSVSVIIAAYNAADSIERAIDSILRQTCPADEIIVVDDGSTDSTAQIVAKYAGNVICITQPNAGPAAARNTGIKKATSQWITFLDADDEWLPEKLETQKALLARNPDLAWCAANSIQCLCDENRKGMDIEPEKARSLSGGTDYFDDYFFAFRNHAGGFTGTMMIRRDVFENVGFFPEETNLAEDLDLWWRIAWKYPKIGYTPDPLAIYHLPQQQTLSSNMQSSQMKILYALVDKHLAIGKDCKQTERLTPVIRFLTTSWIRGLLFKADKQNIQHILDTYGEYMNTSFKTFVKVLMLNPKLTARTCHAISKMVRFTKLRKKITRKPVKNALQ
jgi:glycosyltransferase involved in cell wall biosynthesis